MKPGRVGEPVQVYLDADERQRLARLARQLGATKSDVLRRGLEALERQALDPDAHPALQIVGLATTSPASTIATWPTAADSEEAGCARPRARRPRRRGR